MAFLTEKFKEDLKDRCLIYAEVFGVSLLWFGILFLIALCFIKDWKILLAFAPVFLLPYMVVASTVWGVKLGVMGAKADTVKPPAKAAGKKPEPKEVKK
jgi:hypothetical protein